MRRNPSARTWVCTFLLLPLWLLLLAGPAAAHGGIAAFDVRAAEASGRQAHLEVALTYENDGEPADAGFVTATPVAPDGRTLPPVELERRDGGLYVLDTAVDAEGTWTFRLTSRFPPGSTEVRLEVDGAATETTAADEPSLAEDAPGAPAPEETAGGGSGLYALLGAAGVAVGLLIVFLATREHRRRQRDEEVAGAGTST